MVHSFPVSGYRAGLHDIYFNVLYMKMSISNFIYHIPLADKPRLEAQLGQMFVRDILYVITTWIP